MIKIASLSRRSQSLVGAGNRKGIFSQVCRQMALEMRRTDLDWCDALKAHFASLFSDQPNVFLKKLVHYTYQRRFGHGIPVGPSHTGQTLYELIARAAKADPQRGDDTRRYNLPSYLLEAIDLFGLPLDRDCEDCGLLLPEWWPVEDDSGEDEEEVFSRCPECGGRVGQDLYRLKQAGLQGGG